MVLLLLYYCYEFRTVTRLMILLLTFTLLKLIALGVTLLRVAFVRFYLLYYLVYIINLLEINFLREI